MPIYEVELSDGRRFEVESDQPPSEADVLKAIGGGASEAKSGPQTTPSVFDSGVTKAINALPTVGGFIGSLVGGSRFNPAGMATAGVGGAIGSGLKQAANLVRGRSDLVPDSPMGVAGEALGEAATQSGAQAVGGLAGGFLRLAGRGAYRAGALPLVQQFGKYGDLVKKGLEARIPVTEAGLQKAAGLKAAAQAKKQSVIGATDNTVSIRTAQVAKEATDELAKGATATRRAGLADPTEKIVARAQRFTKQNPPGLRPSEAEGIKSTLSDTLGGAYKKQRMKEPLSATESQNMAYEQALSRGLADTVPGYRAMNREVMDAEGLRRMVARRLQGNQGLENALTMAVGPAAIPARVAMLPGVASSLGIGLHEVGKRTPPVMSNLIRAAILAQLEDE